MTPPLADHEARLRIREDLAATLVVEAAAGTGKTTALVSRIVSLLRSGRTTLEHIVAVTFSERAAGEMKLRLREAIENVRDEPALPLVERARFDDALAALEVARITTIHAFAADLLRERPVESQIDPAFEMAGEDAERRLFGEAFDDWFQRILEDPPEGVRRVLRRRPRRRDEESPRERMRKAARGLAEHRDFEQPWRRDHFDRDGAIDRLLEQLASVGELAAFSESADDWLAKSLAEVRRFIEETRRRERAQGARDYDGLAAAFWGLLRERHWKWKGWPGKFGPKHSAARAARDDAKAQLDGFLRSDDADLAPCLERELSAVVQGYEDMKARAGKLDFLDLLLRARNLVRDHVGVRRELQSRFSHILVDEFQDTDPLQAEILLLLAADNSEEADWRKIRPVPGKLFVVGDPKQSIYRFRRADVALYTAVKRLLVAQGGSLIHLSSSFRAVPSLQEFVNAAFAPVMRASAAGTQPEYIPLQPVREEPGAGQPTIVALPVPRPYGWRSEVTGGAIENSLPDAVGAFIEWLVNESGWTVTDRAKPTERVRVESRHVCILFRRFQGWEDMTRPYVRALESRRIPHVLVGGRAFYEREEVLALRNALEAIERPVDELAVYATLRGPFFALGDDALFVFRREAGRPHPLRRLAVESLSESSRQVADALAILGELHLGRNRRPIADTISRLLSRTRAHAGVAIWPTGEQALANVLRVMDLARRFEAAGATSFRAFVEHLAQAAESGGAADAPIVEEGTEGVRMMTVHKAKGLEFPVVILADPTAPAIHEKPSRHVDPDRRLWVEPLCGCVPPELAEHADEELQRDAEEAIRLVYVAATRVRDLLVVPAVGDEEFRSWLGVLYPALYPADMNRRKPRPAGASPAFGDDSVLERPNDCSRTRRDSVAPGVHSPRVGAHDVVWWDPRALALGKEQELGLRQQKLLQADDAGASDEGIRTHTVWSARRNVVIEEASKPQLLVRRVTELTARASVGEDVSFERTAAPRHNRPGGRRFGVLVHAVLAAVDLRSSSRDGIERIARTQGRLLGATDDEVAAAVEAASGALTHSLFGRAAASEEVCRETPLLLRFPDGTIAEGTLDLAFREGTEWTVVDFKTDAELDGGSRSRYERQVRLYARALSEATGCSARGAILVV